MSYDLNHFPRSDLCFALGFYMTALAMNNVVMKRSSSPFLSYAALLIVPTYCHWRRLDVGITAPVTLPGNSKAVINAHRDMALWTPLAWRLPAAPPGLSCGGFGTLGVFQPDRSMRPGIRIITLGVMAETGHRGGQINHPEIRVATDICQLTRKPACPRPLKP